MAPYIQNNELQGEDQLSPYPWGGEYAADQDLELLNLPQFGKIVAKIPAGTQFKVESMQLHTLSSASYQALNTVNCNSVQSGSEVSIVTGKTVYLLSYAGEGFYKVW